jgi:hypothetical protein
LGRLPRRLCRGADCLKVAEWPRDGFCPDCRWNYGEDLRPASGDRRWRVLFSAQQLTDEHAKLPHPSKGILDVEAGWDLGGGYIPADELLLHSAYSPHGRRRIWSVKSGNEHGKSKWRDNDDVLVELLANEGAHTVERTGNPPGRPAAGLCDQRQIAKHIQRLMPGFDYTSASRDIRAELVLQLLAQPWPVDAAALAELWGVKSRVTIWRLQKHGEALLQQNPDTGGRAVFLPSHSRIIRKGGSYVS